MQYMMQIEVVPHCITGGSTGGSTTMQYIMQCMRQYHNAVHEAVQEVMFLRELRFNEELTFLFLMTSSIKGF